LQVGIHSGLNNHTSTDQSTCHEPASLFPPLLL
jgi:hypothetical protein